MFAQFVCCYLLSFRSSRLKGYLRSFFLFVYRTCLFSFCLPFLLLLSCESMKVTRWRHECYKPKGPASKTSLADGRDSKRIRAENKKIEKNLACRELRERKGTDTFLKVSHLLELSLSIR